MKFMRTALVNTNPSNKENSVNGTKRSGIGLLLGAGLLGTLTGCLAPGPPPDQRAYYSEQPPQRVEYAPREEYAPPQLREAPLRPPPRPEYAPAPRAGERPPPREGFAPPPRGEYAPPPPVRPENAAVSEDDYVYYPGYEIYYNSHRRQYTYREGDSWFTGPTPPRIGVDVLLGAPSVRLDFHDAPQAHHETVVRQYPKHWAPPGQPHQRNEDRGERN
jgi:hypothetical protein